MPEQVAQQQTREGRNPLSRREFIRIGAALAAGLFAGQNRVFAERRLRPNIVFATADDWSWPHAGVYGDRVIKTPGFDRVAHEGVVFTNAFCAAPTCTASRAAILTGQDPHRLGESANLWSTLDATCPVYPEILEDAGYFLGLIGKGWGPGSVEAGGRTRNPAGPVFSTPEHFLAEAPRDRPFCLWFGSRHPHRPYRPGSGTRAGLEAHHLRIPPYLPDIPEVRGDLLDYYAAVAEFDAEIVRLLELLDTSRRSENTLLVVTSDNGMPFPRAKCNLYDAGTRMPLAIKWPGVVKPRRSSDALISLTDLAPTFLEAAGLSVPGQMTGRSFLGLLTEDQYVERSRVFLERERHSNQREGAKSYPMRAARSKDFLYIRNLRPHLWPAGDPTPEDESQWPENLAGRPFGDIDGSPSKRSIVRGRNDPAIAPFFEMACAKRPEEELYDLSKDPWQIENASGRPEYARVKAQMRAALDRWMRETEDPRAKGETDFWDTAPYRR